MGSYDPHGGGPYGGGRDEAKGRGEGSGLSRHDLEKEIAHFKKNFARLTGPHPSARPSEGPSWAEVHEQEKHGVYSLYYMGVRPRGGARVY